MVGGGGKAILDRPACVAVITDNPIDIIASGILALGGGIALGACWTRYDWIAACRKRKLIRNDANTGKLVWRDGGGDVP